MFIPSDNIHSFDVSPKQAIEIQKDLCQKVDTYGKTPVLNYVAGVDVGFYRDQAIAAVTVLQMPNLQLCEHRIAIRPTEFPYIPGLLSFREIPVILDALKKLETTPDIMLCDGQGIAHPRRLGIATHLGVLTRIQTIGVAKSRLTGTHDDVPKKKAHGYLFLIKT